MNRTLNQLINQLHLDPKKEAAVRKIVENAGGINDSTPVVTEVSGNELLPINVNGENKAVSAAALVKGAKEVYFLDIDNYKTPEDYNNLKDAFDSNKLIVCKGVVMGLADLGDGFLGVMNSSMGVAGEETPRIQLNVVMFAFTKDGQIVRFDNAILLDGTGNGTKFLSDDGTYKEVSGGNEPVIIETNIEGEGFENVQLTDQQFEACKNSNVKIKINYPDYYMILIPYLYGFQEEYIAMYVLLITAEGHKKDVALSVNINSKLLSFIA